MAADIDREVRDLIDRACRRCREILERDRAQLETTARYLLEHETMSAEEFARVYETPAAPPEPASPEA